MKSIQGIRSVDFIVAASGEGVVNHNGAIGIFNPAAGEYVNNHLFPKLRGIDPMRREVSKTDADKTKALSLSDPELANAALIVSANCVRSHIFKTASFGVSEVTRDTVGDALASLHGLMRGYLVTKENASFARKSPLFLGDFECAKPGLRYNQGSKAGERSSTAIFSFFATDKNLQYTGYGSISLEDLQFIPLEHSLGRSSFSEVVSEEVGALLAQHVTQYLQDVSGNSDAEAKFVTNAVRIGTWSQQGEAGLLLNDAALSVLVEETLELIRTLYIRQSKGYLRVDSVTVDYNDGQALRILRDVDSAVSQRAQPYARYYAEAPLSSKQFADKMRDLKERLDKNNDRAGRKGSKAEKAAV